MKSCRMLSCIILAFFIAGCFPSAISVGPDGRIALPTGDGVFLINLMDEKATCLYESEKDREVSWVQWSPKGKKILFVIKNDIFTSSPDGEEQKSIYTATGNMGYCLWSPDGKWISIAEVETKLSTPEEDPKNFDDKKKEEYKTGLEKESTPKLTIIDGNSGKVKCSIPHISFMHKWTPDGQSVIVFHITSKDKETGNFCGEIAKLKIGDGSLTPLAYVESTESWLDVSPSGEYIYFTAQIAGESEKKKNDEDKWTPKLFVFSFNNEKKGLKKLAKPASFISVSPNSEQLLIIRDGKDGSELVVLGKDGEDEVIVARGIATQSNEMGEGRIIPAWLNNEEILFWKYTTVLAPGGKSLMAYTAKANGTKIKKINSILEKCVNEAKRAKK